MFSRARVLGRRALPLSSAVAGLGFVFCGSQAVAQCDYVPGSAKNPDHDNSVETFYNFPLSQLFVPSKPYPLWDSNWDFRQKSPSDESNFAPSDVTRHIILIRHGQYDESSHDDAKRVLTPLGRQQSTATGKRLLRMVESLSPSGPVHLKVLHVSDMTRAKETADLIALELLPLNGGKGIERTAPDRNLNEGRPSHVVPSRQPMDSLAVAVDGPRIETAFRTYFYRAVEPKKKKKDKEKEKDKENVNDAKKEGEASSSGGVGSAAAAQQGVTPLPSPSSSSSSSSSSPPPPPASDATVAPPPTRHEFEIIVCHGNVIRYFFMRALQLPPEAWLRLCTFNCCLTYFTIRPNGNISCRSLGDYGHLTVRGRPPLPRERTNEAKRNETKRRRNETTNGTQRTIMYTHTHARTRFLLLTPTTTPHPPPSTTIPIPTSFASLSLSLSLLPLGSRLSSHASRPAA